jgi:transcriptional regulator of met regulon
VVPVFVLFLYVNYFCRKPKKTKKKKKIMIKRINMSVVVKKIKIQANVRKEKNTYNLFRLLCSY